MFKEYLRFIANRRCQQIGVDALFDKADNPFPWMAEMIDLKKEKNFFETRVTEYQTGGALRLGLSDANHADATNESLKLLRRSCRRRRRGTCLRNDQLSEQSRPYRHQRCDTSTWSRVRMRSAARRFANCLCSGRYRCQGPGVCFDIVRQRRT
jgi:hypothetical protein